MVCSNISHRGADYKHLPRSDKINMKPIGFNYPKENYPYNFYLNETSIKACLSRHTGYVSFCKTRHLREGQDN